MTLTLKHFLRATGGGGGAGHSTVGYVITPAAFCLKSFSLMNPWLQLISLIHTLQQALLTIINNPAVQSSLLLYHRRAESTALQRTPPNTHTHTSSNALGF